mgnify:CR=1 FL=1
MYEIVYSACNIHVPSRALFICSALGSLPPGEESHEELMAKFVKRGRHVFRNHMLPAKSQEDNLALSLELFKSMAPRRPTSYTLVMVLRYDFVFSATVATWENINNFAFASRCEDNNIKKNVNDIILSIPGPLFEAFDRSRGHGACFGPGRHGSGHECAIPPSTTRLNRFKYITKTELPLGQVIKFLSPWYGVVRAPGPWVSTWWAL